MALPRAMTNCGATTRTALVMAVIQPNSVIIRSVFGGFTPVDAAPGYYSASILQPVDELVSGFASGRYRAYSSLTSSR